MFSKGFQENLTNLYVQTLLFTNETAKPLPDYCIPNALRIIFS